MLLPTLLMLGNYLALAPAPKPNLNLPETEGKAEWYQPRTGRADLYDDPLPEGAMARIGTARCRFGDSAFAIAFSPDGRTLAAAGYAGVHLLDSFTGKILAHFTAPKAGSFKRVAFVLGGKYLATQTDAGHVLIWRMAPGMNRPLQGPQTDRNSGFALADDGKLLAFVKDKTIHLWDVKRGKDVVQLPRHEAAYWLEFSADGKLLASMGGGAVALWDAPAGKLLRQIPPAEEGEDAQSLRRRRESAITEPALSPDGKILAGFIRAISGQSVIRLWETTTGKELRALQVIDHTTRALAFSPDGHFLALASQNHFQVWDVRSGETRWHFPMLDNSFWAVCFSPDGRFVAGGLSSIVKIWETETGRERVPIAELRGVRYFSLSADGRTVLTSEQSPGGAADSYEPSRKEANLRCWDAASGNRLLPPPGQEKHFPPFAALSRDQRTLLSWGAENTLQVWDVNTGKKRCDVSREGYPRVRNLSEDGKLLVLGSHEPGLRGRKTDARLVLWDAQMGKRLGEFKGHRGFLIEVSLSPDGKVLASVDGDYVFHLWETANQKEIVQFKLQSLGWGRLAFSHDSRLLAVACHPPDVVFWEVPSGKKLPKMPTAELAKKHRFIISDLLFSPNGKHLITADHEKVFIWERATGRLVKEWSAGRDGASWLAISADAKVLLTRGAYAALAWNLESLMPRE